MLIKICLVPTKFEQEDLDVFAATARLAQMELREGPKTAG